MKNGKAPTREQKKIMKAHGLVPENWLVVKMMLSRLVDTFFSRTSWTMLLYAENHSISVA